MYPSNVVDQSILVIFELTQQVTFCKHLSYNLLIQLDAFNSHKLENIPE